jgi:hypothetical protein
LVGSATIAFVVEIVWRLRYHIASPATGMLFVVGATAIGRGGLAASARTRSPRGGSAEAFAAGVATLAVLFGLLSHFHLLVWFLPLSWTFAGASLVATRPRQWLGRRVGPASILAGIGIFFLVVRASYFTDRLDLTTPYPRGFAWIDSPLWLSIAHGAERGCPPPDLLYSGGALNYHFGQGLVVAAIRAMTGLSMQTSYFVAMVTSSVALVMLLATHARLLLRAPRAACIATALVGVTLLEYITYNFPTIVALPVFLWLLLEVRRIQKWERIPILVVGVAYLMVAKEVEYVLFLLLGGWIAALRLWKERRWHAVMAVILPFFVTRPFYDQLIRIDQRALLRPFVEHFDLDWVVGEISRRSTWLLLGTVAICVSVSAGKRANRYTAVLGGVFLAYLALVTLGAFVKPTFVPPMDPFSYGWILRDMEQFELHGRLVLGAALVGCALAATQRAPFEASRRWVVSTAAIAGLTIYSLVNLWKVAPQSISSPRPEERGNDPVVPLLAQIDPRIAVIATDRINWNDENPHWAAFFGHQFFMQRRGRWTTAYADYKERLESQRVLFATASVEDAMRIVARGGITHVIETREHPVPWLAQRPPTLENEAYRVYDVRRP